MAIAPASTTAKELRFERSAPPSRVFKCIIYCHRLFPPLKSSQTARCVFTPLEARPPGWRSLARASCTVRLCGG